MQSTTRTKNCTATSCLRPKAVAAGRVAPASRRLSGWRHRERFFAGEQMPARRRRYIVGPVPRRVSSHLYWSRPYWSRPFSTSTTRAMLMAIQYLTKFALKGTAFRLSASCLENTGGLGPSHELTRYSIRAFLFHSVEILKRDSSTHGHCARAKKQEIHRRVTSSVIATLFFNCYSSGTSVHLESVV